MGNCPGYHKTINLFDGICIRIPLYNEYQNKSYYKEMEMEFHKKGVIAKDEVFIILKDKYNIKFSNRNLQYYVDEGLLEPGKKDRIPGTLGTFSFYKEYVPGWIYAIQELKNKYNLTLKEIKSFKEVIQNFDPDTLDKYFPKEPKKVSFPEKINSLERYKFRTTIKYLAFAKSVIKRKSKIWPLIYPIYSKGQIREIKVIIKDYANPSYSSIKDLNIAKRITIDKDGVIDSPEELKIFANLETIRTVIFKKGKIEVT